MPANTAIERTYHVYCMQVKAGKRPGMRLHLFLHRLGGTDAVAPPDTTKLDEREKLMLILIVNVNVVNVNTYVYV